MTKRFFFFLLLLLATRFLYSQVEICNNNIDDDGDGLIDCFDDDCCMLGACDDFWYDPCLKDGCLIEEPANLVIASQVIAPEQTFLTLSNFVVGDLEGDGVNEIVIITNVETVQILNAVTQEVKFTIDPGSGIEEPRLLIADVVPSSPGAEIVYYNGSNIQAFSATGAPLWSTENISGRIVLSAADFDQDGAPEIYTLNRVFNGNTGAEILFIPDAEVFGIVKSNSMAMDILPDSACPDCSGLELIADSKVYAINIATGAFTLQRDNSAAMAGSSLSVGVDWDNDGTLDVFSMSESRMSVWTPLTDVELYNITIPVQIRGLPSINDIDGDGQPEAVYVSDEGNGIITAMDNDLSLLWTRDFIDRSGYTSVTMFDFDDNGTLEIVYRDERRLGILDGRDGTPLEVFACTGVTQGENPVVVDYNMDDEAEILVVCGLTFFDSEGRLTAFSSGGATTWADCRSVWNQENYFNTHINDDLTVPAVQQAPHLPSFGRSLNAFLNQYQIPRIEPLEITIETDEELNCTNPSIILRVNSSTDGLTYSWEGTGVTATGDTLIVTEGGEYIVTGVKGGICSASDTIQVEVSTSSVMTTATKSSDLDCTTSAVTLTATSSETDDTYAWSGPAGFTATGQTVSVFIPGTFTLTTTNAAGTCTGTAMVTVERAADDLMTTAAKSSDLDCTMSAVTLTATSSETDDTYAWSGPAGFTATGQTVSVTEPGTYTLTTTNAAGTCSGTATVTVEPLGSDLITTATKSSDLDCSTGDVTLTATSSATDDTYAWSGPAGFTATGQTVSVTEPGTYTLTTTNAAGSCSGTAMVMVDFLDDFAAEIEVTQPDCSAETGEISIVSVDGGINPFSYSVDGGINFSSDPIFSDLPPGDYNVVVEDSFQCVFTAEIITLLVPDTSFISLPDSLFLSEGGRRVLTPELSVNEDRISGITWGGDANLSCRDCLTPVLTAASSQVLSLIILLDNGCRQTIQVVIIVSPGREAIYFPTAFSPHDANGTNDVFRPYGATGSTAEIVNFEIYDRWGGLVFGKKNLRINDPDSGWGGMVNSQKAPTGVYVYYTTVEFEDGSSELFKGSVLLQ